MQESFMKLSRGETTCVLFPFLFSYIEVGRSNWTLMVSVIVCLDSPEEHDKLDTLSRNRLSNVSFAIQSLGELIFLAFLVGILFALKSVISPALLGKNQVPGLGLAGSPAANETDPKLSFIIISVPALALKPIRELSVSSLL